MESRVDGSVTVMLTCDEYDNEVIESISVSSTASLDENADGSFRTDAQGNSYFHYDYSKILQNMTTGKLKKQK